MAAQRVLRNTQATLEVTFYSGGTPTDADGAVTVDITRGDGTSFAAGAATVHGTTGVYRYTLAPQTDLEYLTLVWTGTFAGVVQKVTTHVEIVGAFYVPLADIRALDGLSSSVTFPDASLIEARQWFEDLFEDFCGWAAVPRYRRELRWGDGSNTLELRRTPVRRLLSVKIDGVAQTFTGWIVEALGTVTRDSGLFTRGVTTGRIEVTYEYGEDEADAEIRQAALLAIRRRLLGDRSGIPEGALTMTTTEGGFTLGIAGENRPTGIPSVDAVLIRRKRNKGTSVPLVG